MSREGVGYMGHSRVEDISIHQIVRRTSRVHIDKERGAVYKEEEMFTRRHLHLQVGPYL